MIFGQNRNELRRMYADAWQKHSARLAMSPLEAQIAAVIAEHPEYHAAVSGDLQQEYTVEKGATNPFLHMGLHLGIRDQVATNRPAGIRAIFESLAKRLGDHHAAEHLMLDCLAETLWESQSRGLPPDEQGYLLRLRAL